MGETEFEIFVVLINLILVVLITGIIVFFLKYHKRKLLGEQEKAMLRQQHAEEILHSRLEMQQQTMQDIGREIHDNVGQLLTVASLYAHQAAHEHPQQAQSAEVGRIIDQSLAELRKLSKHLTNGNAGMDELMEQVKTECHRINQLAICEVSCSQNYTTAIISATVKNFVLRIIQEFVQNSLKHAACSRISLKLDHTAEGLAIAIQDNGAGFEVAGAIASGKGIGLGNMRKRAELIGAGFALNSSPGNGTQLHISIPSQNLITHQP